LWEAGFFYILGLSWLSEQEESMYLQEILEVAIGLVFLWLVLSIAAMSFQEYLANALKWRARELEKAIVQMLSSEDLARRFYQHPLIANLYAQPKNPKRKPRLPSYISASKFSAALFELVIDAGTDESPVKAITGEIEKQLAAIENPEQQKLGAEDWQAILETAKQVAASEAGAAAVDSLKQQLRAYAQKYPQAQGAVDGLLPELDAYYAQFVEEQRASQASSTNTSLAMRQFRLGLLALQKANPKLKESVEAVIREVEAYALRGEQEVANARVSIETWFNDVMDRLSGSYKRRSTLVAFIIGFVLAVILNIDSINVATSLWREPTLRQAIVAQAEAYTPPATSADGSPRPLEAIPALQTALKALSFPAGWTSAVFDTGGRQCSLLPLNSGQVWGIPSKASDGTAVCKQITNVPVDVYGWLAKILGFLMTGAAAAQGAPFWFDILKKLVNVRSSGVNPSEKQPAG
jgi:hypothetical protein